MTGCSPHQDGFCKPCSCMRLNRHGIPWRPCSYVYVRIWWRHNSALMCSCVLFEWILYRVVLCIMVARCLEIKLKTALPPMSAVYRGNMPLCSYPPISVSPFLPRPIPHSIKLGRVSGEARRPGSNYVTDRKWWTLLVRNVDSVS